MHQVLEKRGLLDAEEIAISQKLANSQTVSPKKSSSPGNGDGTPKFDR
jgi:hypothetical protein